MDSDLEFEERNVILLLWFCVDVFILEQLCLVLVNTERTYHFSS